MSKDELGKFKNTLRKKVEELTRDVRAREGIAIEKSPDEVDEIRAALDRELAILNLDRDSNLLRNVRAALKRIELGQFGVCPTCRGQISQKRLTAIPWAEYCIQCQELADRQQPGQEGGSEPIFA